VVAISKAPLWCSIIMVRHMVSNSLPDMVFSAAMCLAFIMPGMAEPPDWFMPDIDPIEPPDAGAFMHQDFSQPVMVLMSGSYAFSIRAARSLTWEEEAWSAASCAICTAC
jgi:hypothetical protein